MAPSIALVRAIPGTSKMDGAIDTSGGLPRAQLGTARSRTPARHPADGHELRSQYRANVNSYGTGLLLRSRMAIRMIESADEPQIASQAGVCPALRQTVVPRSNVGVGEGWLAQPTSKCPIRSH